MHVDSTYTYTYSINRCMFALLLLLDSTRLACIFYNKWNVCQQCLTFATRHAHWPEPLYTFTPQPQMCNVSVCACVLPPPSAPAFTCLLAMFYSNGMLHQGNRQRSSCVYECVWVCVCVCWATVNIYVKLLLYTSDSHRKCQLDNDYCFSQSGGKEGRKEGHALDSQLHKRRID